MLEINEPTVVTSPYSLLVSAFVPISAHYTVCKLSTCTLAASLTTAKKL